MLHVKIKKTWAEPWKVGLQEYAYSDQGPHCLLIESLDTTEYMTGEQSLMKTYLYNFDPLKPHFYIVKLGFTGVYIISLFLLKNIDYGYSLE